MNDINDWPGHPDADPDCECCLGDGLQADGETPCPCIDARRANIAAQTITPAPQPEAATPAAQEAVACLHGYCDAENCPACSQDQEVAQPTEDELDEAWKSGFNAGFGEAMLTKDAPDAVARLVEAAKWVRDQSCEGFCRDLPRDDYYDKEMDIDCAGCRVRAALAAMEASHDRA